MGKLDAPILVVAFVLKCIKKVVGQLVFDVIASLAQWQSTGLVNQGSRVQIPHEAVLFGSNVSLINFDSNKIHLFSCGTSLQLRQCNSDSSWKDMYTGEPHY